MISRRQLMKAASAAAVVSALDAEAQQASKVARVAFITTTSPEGSPTTDAFKSRLRDLGYVEGQNVIIEWRWGRGTTERFTEFAADVVARRVDVIVAANGPAGRAAQKATTTIPIVIPTLSDPIGDGFVATLAHPGGNITGLTFQLPELQGKRLQLFKEAAPSVTRVALLVDATDRYSQSLGKQAEAAARALALQPQPLIVVRRPNDINAAFETFAKERAGGVLVVGGTMLYANRVRVAERALGHRLPMMCEAREHAEVGCLMSYAASLGHLFRRTADLVDKILKGAKPADLPVEQPTKFELVINMKTAKALGLTIPPSLLLRADQIIQ